MQILGLSIFICVMCLLLNSVLEFAFTPKISYKTVRELEFFLDKNELSVYLVTYSVLGMERECEIFCSEILQESCYTIFSTVTKYPRLRTSSTTIKTDNIIRCEKIR